jgi:hypothetical protein
MNHIDLDDPSFWENYNNYLMSPYDMKKDEELLKMIEANPPPKELPEPEELEPMVA